MGKDSDLLEGLDERQREVVTHTQGPLLVIAGPGTGKTLVITHRIAYLIAQKMARPEEILALTFTDKAAREMEERVDILVPYGFVNVQIGTFHSFGQSLLREYGLQIGVDPDFKVLTPPEVMIYLRQHLFELPLTYYRPLSNPTKFLSAIVNLISRAKDEDVTPEEYIQYADLLEQRAQVNPDDGVLREEAEKAAELAQFYQKYEELLLQTGFIDIPGLISLPLRLLRTRPNILAQLQSKFKYILVDEFQDTNYSQFQLVRLLAARHRNITVVGDDDQSIYKFRGAAITNILSFCDVYPDAKQVVLTRNYRSTQPILDTAYRLILHNNPNRLEVRRNIDKHITGVGGDGLPVRHFHYDSLPGEADAVARMIGERMDRGGYNYSDFAVLVRANSHADPFLRALNMKGIPWRFSGNQGLYDREEIKTLLSLLKVIRDPDDSASLYHLASSTVYQINPLDMSRCLGYAHKSKVPLRQVFLSLNELEEVSAEGRATAEKLLADIDYLNQLSMRAPTGKVLYEFLTRTGWLKRLTSESSVRNEIQVKNIAQFFEVVQKVSEFVEHDRVPFTLEYLEMLKESGDNPPVAEADFDLDAVNVLTVHRAKGLEFRVVFLVCLVHDRFPSEKGRKRGREIALPDELIKEPLPAGDFHLEEERRLFYVGMTRAKEELILTSSRDVGLKKPKKVSQFVIEALDLKKEEIIPHKATSIEVINRFGSVLEKDARYLPAGDGLFTLSSQQVDDYLTCPLKYKYIHILRVPIPPHHTMIYGKAIHRAVAEYYQAKKRCEKITLDKLISVFEGSWSSEGFLTREHEERRLAQGKEVLKRFFEQEQQKDEIPTYVEEEFSFVQGNIKLIGRWDRVDVTQEGGIIIDYKTSEVRDQGRADSEARNSVQLPIYAMAYRERFGQLPVGVEFRFLETGLVGRLKNLERRIEQTKAKIEKVADRIKQRDFSPSPQYMACEFCPYRGICPYEEKR